MSDSDSDAHAQRWRRGGIQCEPFSPTILRKGKRHTDLKLFYNVAI